MLRNKVLLVVCFMLMCLAVLPVVAQETPENPLLRMLSFVPDTPENRQYLSYGDLAAWHQSWDVPRLDNLDDLEALPRDLRAYWMIVMPSQTIPPQVMGLQYVRTDDMRNVYGFDVFNVDRYLSAGQPPDMISVVEYSFPDEQIADALVGTGYESQSLADDVTLYSILDDYEIDVARETIPTRVGQLGDLNRIALLDGQMLIAKATPNIEAALSANQGAISSLADDPAYVAAVTALDDPALGDMGQLVGVILVDGLQLSDPLQYVLLNFSPEEVTRFLEEVAGEPSLPFYYVAAFGTQHSPGATHLVLALVFPEGVDAKEAANVLAERIQNYESLVTQQTLEDRWTFELATGTKVNDLPVALISMRVDDPPPSPEGEELANASVFAWNRMILARDTAFLIAGE